MIKNILRDIRHILDNEGGFWWVAASAVASLASSNSKRNAEMAAKAKDVELQRARLEKARVRSTDNLTETARRAREAAQQREIAIESSRIQAESKIEETFAGSGISGTSVDEFDNELNASIAKNKQENLDALSSQIGSAYRDYSDNIENVNEQAESVDSSVPERDILGEIGTAVGVASSFSSTIGKMQKYGKKEGQRTKDTFINKLGNFLAI